MDTVTTFLTTDLENFGEEYASMADAVGKAQEQADARPGNIIFVYCTFAAYYTAKAGVPAKTIPISGSFERRQEEVAMRNAMRAEQDQRAAGLTWEHAREIAARTDVNENIARDGLVSLDTLVTQLMVLREMEGGDIPIAVAVPGDDGFTTLEIGMCAPPIKLSDYGGKTALVLAAVPSSAPPPSIDVRQEPAPSLVPLPAKMLAREHDGDHVEPADPKELQNDGDPIKAAAMPPRSHPIPIHQADTFGVDEDPNAERS